MVWSTRSIALSSLALVAVSASTASAALQFRPADLVTATDAYNSVFYTEYNTDNNVTKASYFANSEGQGRPLLWRESQQIATLIDVHQATQNEEYKQKVKNLYNGIIDKYTENWSEQSNTDIAWTALLVARVAELFNDGSIFRVAVANLETVYTRSWDEKNGGLWNSDKKTKNADTNLAVALAYLRLFAGDGNEIYRDRAHTIMHWVKDNLYKESPGYVLGAVDTNGRTMLGPFTHNIGAFIGAATVLDGLYPEDDWKTKATNCAEFAMLKFSGSGGILPDENKCDTSNNCLGYKSIFARYIYAFVAQYHLSDRFGKWLEDNANAAWNVHNANSLSWGSWSEQTPDTGVFDSWETVSALSIYSATFTYSN